MLPVLPHPPRWPGFRIGSLRFHRVHQDDLGVKPLLCIHRQWRDTHYRVLCIWWAGWRLRWSRWVSLEAFKNSVAGKLSAWSSCTPPHRHRAEEPAHGGGESVAAEQARQRFAEICKTIKGDGVKGEQHPVRVAAVFGCSRCGTDHLRVRVRPLSNPPPFCGEFAVCPETNEPILFFSGGVDVPTKVRHSYERIFTGPEAAKRWQSCPQSGGGGGTADEQAVMPPVKVLAQEERDGNLA